MTDAMHLILIVEDDVAIQGILRLLFETNGFRVVIAGNAARGELDAELNRPDVVLVDLGLPDRDGITVIDAIRKWSAVPILILSARTAESERLEAFAHGADDYVMKPFSAPELLARVKATVRRYVRGSTPMAILQLGDVKVDLSSRVATHRDGTSARLTPLEHRILETLLRDNERIVSRATLMKEVWGPHREDLRSLRVYIASLRKKLEINPARPRHILTVLSVGYRLVLNAGPHTR